MTRGWGPAATGAFCLIRNREKKKDGKKKKFKLNADERRVEGLEQRSWNRRAGGNDMDQQVRGMRYELTSGDDTSVEVARTRTELGGTATPGAYWYLADPEAHGNAATARHHRPGITSDRYRDLAALAAGGQARARAWKWPVPIPAGLEASSAKAHSL